MTGFKASTIDERPQRRGIRPALSCFMPGALVLTPLGLILVWSMPLAAQAGAADPWSRVPAFPNGCYATDDFGAKITKALEALDADLTKQTTINADLKAKFEALDIGEKAQRMQAFMMKDPQQAMKYMQAMQSAGNTATLAVQASVADSPKLDQELNDHTANFHAAVDRALTPTRAAIKQLIDTKTLPAEGDAIIFAAASDTARYNALNEQLDMDYGKLCGAWWGANGTFQAWLKGYRTYLVNDVVAAKDANEGAIVLQMAIMDSPTGGYRSTAALEAVRTYMDKASRIYAIRPGGKFGQATGGPR